MSRCTILVALSACLCAPLFIVTDPVHAQGVSASNANGCWIDSATGQPHVFSPHPGVLGQQERETHQASYGGHNYFVDPASGSWVDSATGQPHVFSPHSGVLGEQEREAHQASYGGHNYFFRVPCTPPQTASSTGLYIGGELAKNSGHVRSTERLDATDAITNQFNDRADPVGGGFLIGYNFTPWANNVVVSPFASFDFVNAPVNHTFASGSFLGTTANFIGTGGVKIGPRLDMGVWLYGIAGVSVLNETLNVNFIPVASSKSATVAGGTLGFGAAIQPSFLQGFGRPVSVFAEYQHTWWQDGIFNTPASSPAFNYNFRREDDLVKLGFTVSLNAPPAASAYPVKAPALK
jgi:hypothetical protein